MRMLTIMALLAAQDPKPNIPTEQYESREIEGWTVRVNKALLGDKADLGKKAIRLLEVRLYEITLAVPARPLAELRKVPIWLGVDDYIEERACYHPNVQWLRDHGLNPDKAKAVEIGNAASFLKEARHQPMMVLHELAHSYHDRILGFDHPGILEAYAKAKQSGIYDSVLRISGKKEKAYAITHPHEYFAEACEAFFGTNDYYPFVRAELREFDPALYRILEEVWRN
jgi:hypothetical protein